LNAEEFMNRPIWFLVCVLLLATAAPSVVRAQPPAAPSPSPTPAAAATPATAPSLAAAPEARLKTVVVTATRIAQPIADIGTTISVIGSEQLDTQKIPDAATALREVPGVQITQSGSPGTVTDASIRGSSPSQTLVLLDGVDVNAGATGEFNFANLTTDNVDRIEVLRGAGGSLYGSEAIGGVINVISQEGEGAPRIDLLSEGGNRATQRQLLTLGGAEGALGFSGALSYFSTEGFRPVNDNSDNLSGNLRLDWHLDSDTTVRGFARYTRANVSLPSANISLGFPLDPNAHERTEFMLYKGEIEHRFGERLTVRASAYFVRDEIRDNELPFDGSTSSLIDDIPDETRGGNIESVYKWSKNFTTVAGFDFKDRWVRTNSVFSFPPYPPSVSIFRARRQEYAGYLEQEASLFHDQLLLTGGFRADGNSQFGEEVSPAWSIAIPIKKISTTLRGSYSEGFRAPSFDELYYPFYGNPHLSPEISSEYDGGFTTTFGSRASLTATYFSRRVHSLIVTVPVPTSVNPFGSEAGNAGRVDVQGVEVVPRLTLVEGLVFSGSVTIIEETHAPGTSKARPLRVPKYGAAALLQYVRGGLLRQSDRATATLAYTFVGDRDDITPEGTVQNHAAYDRFDLTVSYALGQAWRMISDEQAFARVSNLLDRHYSETFGFPAPPVNFVAGVKLELE
jgi:vitamin B12 transporter